MKIININCLKMFKKNQTDMQKQEKFIDTIDLVDENNYIEIMNEDIFELVYLKIEYNTRNDNSKMWYHRASVYFNYIFEACENDPDISNYQETIIKFSNIDELHKYYKETTIERNKEILYEYLFYLPGFNFEEDKQGIQVSDSHGWINIVFIDFLKDDIFNSKRQNKITTKELKNRDNNIRFLIKDNNRSKNNVLILKNFIN